MEKPWKQYAKWKKPVAKDLILHAWYDFISIKYPENQMYKVD